MADEEKLGKYKTDATLTELQASSIFKDQSWPIDNGETSVAEDVIKTFDLDGNPTGGSPLLGYDIYNRDPYQMIQLSLAAAAFGDSNTPMKECYINGDGNVVFNALGTGSSATDIYYSVPSDSYELTCDTVVVTGCEIPPSRELRAPQNLFTLGNTSEAGEIGPWYHAIGNIVPAKNMFQEGWIEYSRLQTGDKIKETWDLGDFENIVTFAYVVKIGFFDSGCTDVQFRDSSIRYYELPSFGTMQEGHRLKVPIEGTSTPAMLDGVEVPDSSQRKFKGVRRVLIYGYKLNGVRFYHDAGGAIVTPYVYVDTLQPSVFELRRGDDYVVNKTAGEVAKITFANNVVRSKYREFFGKSTPTAPVAGASSFMIHPESIITAAATDVKVPDPTIVVAGKLADGVSDATGGLGINTPSVFPIGKGESGYAVLKLFVEVDWDNPSIFIKDSRDIITTTKLKEEVSIQIYPIVVDDPPAPMAHNGTLITQADVKPDDDPATSELWSRSDKQLILDSLKGGDMNITLPFLDEAGVEQASSAILSLRNESVSTTAYTCGPNCNPDLGASGPGITGGVINRIVYSYQDSSRYVVNVYCGRQWQGINGWAQSINEATTEQKSFDGKVINASTNNTDFVVLVNGIGQIPCVNATKDIICNGDKVKITVYNNPSGVR